MVSSVVDSGGGGRRPDGFPWSQWHRYPVHDRLAGRVEQQFDCAPAHLEVRNGHTCQLRRQPAGQVGIVERDDREVVRHAESEILAGLVDPHRDPVVEQMNAVGR